MMGKHLKPWIIFIIGVIPVICFRVVTIAQHYSIVLGKVFWYAAVVTSLVFYYFIYAVALKRYKIITAEELDEKIEKKSPLDKNDYKNLHYILTSIIISKERLNFFIIFIASIVTIAIAVYLDFVK